MVSQLLQESLKNMMVDENSTTLWLCIEKYDKRQWHVNASIRPCPASYEEIIDLIEKNEYVQLEGALRTIQWNETVNQFVLRMAAEGVGADFKIESLLDENYHELKFKLTDLHTGKVLINFEAATDEHGNAI